MQFRAIPLAGAAELIVPIFVPNVPKNSTNYCKVEQMTVS
jgi:hypothetical protein